MQTEPVFTSERLVFREFQPGDGRFIYDLNSDPEVLKYLHETPIALGEAERVVAEIIRPQYIRYNHGRWATYLKTSGEFVGWCGLKFREELGMTDLGYRFKKQFWGQGLASEAARSSIKYGVGILHITSFFGAAHVDNLGSQKVLEKTGFHYQNTRVIDGCLAKTYLLTSDFINP